MEHELGDLLRAIGSSVQEAQNALERNTVGQYLDFFSEKGETYEPKQLNFQLVDAVETVTVPLVALTPQSNMVLDQVNITFNVSTSFDPHSSRVLLAPTRPTNNDSELGEVSQNRIEMSFRRDCTSEGISRVNQQYIKHV